MLVTPRLSEQRNDGPLAEHLRRHPGPLRGVELCWLGQAGFVIRAGGLTVMIDPYLSDTLAVKYRGSHYPHQRMMAAPITPQEVDRLDLVLCTHRHGDHMDPGTLQPLAQRFPTLRFVVPAAEWAEARVRCGVGDARLVPAEAGVAIAPWPGLRVLPLPSAHETLQRDAQGQHHWLGYVLEMGGVRLYHSGDCVSYDGLAAHLRAAAPDLALLPVNGRDGERAGRGVPGNFTLDEAVALCREAGVGAMLAHHHGLFDFNTVAPEAIDARSAAEAAVPGLALRRTRPGVRWQLLGRSDAVVHRAR